MISRNPLKNEDESQTSADHSKLIDVIMDVPFLPVWTTVSWVSWQVT